MGTWFVSWTSWVGITCPEESGSGDACFSASGLVRISFCLAIFQFTMFVITLTRTGIAAKIHDGLWTIKFLIVGVLFIISMWIPNEPVIIGYMKFARIFSIFFLSYQAIMMLIVAYVINHALVSSVNKHGQGSGCSGTGIVLLVLFITFTIGNIIWIIY